MSHQNQNHQVDRFTFTDTQSKDFQIVFLPQTLRHNRKVPQLDYQGLEGKFTFRGNEIKQQHSHLGLLISVTLKTNPNAERLDFALVLPQINLESQKIKDFETVAIATTRNQKIISNRSRTEFAYKVLTLKGWAEKLNKKVEPVLSAAWQNPYSHCTEWLEERYNLIDFPRF